MRLPRLSLGHATLVSIGVDVTLALGTLVTTPYLVHHIGTEPYGILAMVSVIAGQLGVLHLGVGPAATRQIAEARGRGDARAHSAVLVATAVLSVAAAVLVAAGFLVVAPWAWTHRFRGSAAVVEEALAAMPPAAVVVALQPVLLSLMGALAGEERFATLSAWRVAQGLGRMAAAVAVVHAGAGARGVLWAHASVDVVALVAGLTAWSPPRQALATSALRPALRGMLSMGVPFAVAGLLAAILVDAEKLAIGMARSIEDFTYYTVPFNAVSRLTMFAGALSVVLVPRLASVAAGGDRLATGELVRRATRFSVATMSLLLAPLVAAAPELLGLWLGPHFAERSTTPMRVILVALLANASASPCNSAVRARARPSALTWLYAAEVPLHLATVYVFVRAWGIAGAALAWATRVVIDFGGQYLLAQRALGTSIGGLAATAGPTVVLAAFAAGCEIFGGALPPVARVGLGLVLGAATASLVLMGEDWQVAFRTLAIPSR